MNRIIHKITPAVPKAPKLMNVAAYARVSIHQCLCYRCFLHILRRVRLLVFLSAVGVGIGLLKFLQRDYRVLGAGVIPFADEVRFLVAFTKIKVLKARVLPCHLDNLVHPVLFHHIGHNVAQIDSPTPSGNL